MSHPSGFYIPPAILRSPYASYIFNEQIVDDVKRHTWGTVQAYTDHVQGWLGRLVAPLVRWYAPHFNAYTFVLARSNEYQADAAAAELVGTANAAHALKRVNIIRPQHQRLMRQTFERMITTRRLRMT